ncbi:MAG: glycine cleavage system aminomethyltransferase GcvT [Candidatus Omnitrophica bacterium]|nr:glycine cleavage system aminomethyltransferase GcvT [Candidatus Omnitrophota bacterium]
MSNVGSSKNTALVEEHVSLGAKMVDFAGWNMPLQYEGILQEFEYNRKTASLFDCSHMGEFFIEGTLTASGLSRIVTQKLTDMPVKTCRYGTMLNENGGTIDDLIVYKISEEKWMVVVNAANIDKDRRHFLAHLSKSSGFQDVSLQTAKLDLQGPMSREVLGRLVPGIQTLEYYGFDHFDLLGEKVIISRTGYTGELGYEIYFPWTKVKELWKEILKNDNVKPTGLGVRDVLRIEMCYPLYGHELEEIISPFDAGLKKFVDLSKDFIGKDGLLKREDSGLKRNLVCFASSNRRAPRAEHKLYSLDGYECGVVTSGTFSPALTCGIGIGLVREPLKAGDQIIFGDEKSKNSAVVVSRPFYKSGSLKN